MSKIFEEKDPVKLLELCRDYVKRDIRKPADGRVRSTEELMFGAESRAAVREAVRRAVERADALGLPKAYEPDFSAARKVREAEEKHKSMAPK